MVVSYKTIEQIKILTMRKSTTSRTKPSPRTTSPRPTTRSPKPTTDPWWQGETLAQDKLKDNRERLTHTLDTLAMLIRSDNPIRCLEHNSVVSLFCLNDNRLLCSNCVFGSSVHKFHKINPVDNSAGVLVEENRKMESVVRKEAKTLTELTDIILQNMASEQAQLHKTLSTLSLKFKEAQHLLQESFINYKQTLITTMKGLRVRHQRVTIELQLLKELYSSAFTPEYLHSSQPQLQSLLYRHSVLRTLTNQKKFEGNVHPQGQSVLKQLGSEGIRLFESVLIQLRKIQ